MLKSLHQATASFVSPETAIWKNWVGRDLGTGKRVFGHCDTGPWNIVARNNLPYALIDWEFAGSVDPLNELAQACWLKAQLVDDDIATCVGLPPIDIRAKQVRSLLDGYEFASHARAGFVDRLIEFALHDAAS